MSDHTIITINREYGSEGQRVADRVGKTLGIPVHGDDIVGMASKYHGISEEKFSNADERPADSLLFLMSENTFSLLSPVGYSKTSLSSDELFRKQSEVIKRFAETEDCVIIGRCGNHILRNEPGCIAVFITADLEIRIDNVMRVEGVGRREAAKRIRKMDQKRSRYYGYYSGRDWDACSTYDLVVNTGRIGVDKAAEVICNYVKLVRGDSGQ